MSARSEVLAVIPAEHRAMVGLAANCRCNMAGGRPSDAARSEVAEFQRLGAEEYTRRFDAERAAR